MAFCLLCDSALCSCSSALPHAWVTCSRVDVAIEGLFLVHLAFCFGQEILQEPNEEFEGIASIRLVGAQYLDVGRVDDEPPNLGHQKKEVAKPKKDRITKSQPKSMGAFCFLIPSVLSANIEHAYIYVYIYAYLNM